MQAYQKRAGAVIDWIADMAAALDRRLMVRLVKGAYWDTEIKRAQERGLADYPVFTRKAMTDLCYLDCARKLLGRAAAALSAIRHPQCAHGRERDRGCRRRRRLTNSSGCTAWARRFIRRCSPSCRSLTCRVYAPVGGYADLLAYLVRRLLENGANSSFVSVAADPAVPIETILRRPQSWIADPMHARHPHIPLPRDLFAPERRNSAGVEFGDRAALDALLAEIGAAPQQREGGAAGRWRRGRRARAQRRRRRSTATAIGTVQEGDEAIVAAAMAAAQAGFRVLGRDAGGRRAPPRSNAPAI